MMQPEEMNEAPPLSPNECEPILEFLKSSYIDQLAPIMLSEQEHLYYSVDFDLLAFIYEFPHIGSLFHQHSEEFLNFVRHAMITCEVKLLDVIPQSETLSVKRKLDIKLTHVPPVPEIVCEFIRNMGQEQLGKIAIIFGTVVRTSNVNSRELIKDF